jgi:hypothetical protein
LRLLGAAGGAIYAPKSPARRVGNGGGWPQTGADVAAATNAGDTSDLRTFDGICAWRRGHVAVELIDADEHQALPGDVREGLAGSRV